ncbi:3'-5' exonuclease [Vibrio alginolyticus]
MKPTLEQQNVIYKPVRLAVIKALAGTGKTTLFRLFANAYPELRMLYITYNRPIADAANLPPNCLSLTGHQLAYQFVGKYYRHKFAENLSMGLIRKHLRCDWSIANGTMVTLENYFCSEDQEIEKKHAPYNPKNKKSLDIQEQLVSSAKQIWNEMQLLESPVPMTHDGYLKGFSIAQVDLSAHFDVLLVDEGQDLNPAVRAFMKAQTNMRVYVCGDESQQIYRYRGAEDALKVQENSGAEVFSLTQSFRFNEQVATYANAFLNQLGVHERLKGTDNGIIESVLTSENDLDENLQIAYINRTIVLTIEVAIEADERGKSIYWTGGFNNYPFNELFDLLYLKLEQYDKIRSRDFKRDFTTFEDFVEVAKKTKNIDMARILRLVSKYDTGLFDIYENLKRSKVDNIEAAEVVVGTCHRTKGLEFDQVVLGDDFCDQLKLIERTEDEIRDELNLMYVAITRAKLRFVESHPFHSVQRCSQNIFELAREFQKNKRSSSGRFKKRRQS